VLWVRSAFVRDTIRLGPGARVTILESSGGELAYLRGTYQTDGKFLLVRKAVRMSHLTPAALLALPPLAWLLWVLGPGGERLRTRARKGLCVHCGYDLRATPGARPPR
jgi:hypothetical protein